MKTPILSCAVAMFIGASTLHAQTSSSSADEASPYINVTAIYAIPNWDNVKNGFGGSLALGMNIKERHFVEAELMYLKFDVDDNQDMIQGVALRASGKIDLMPILATYRYDIPLGNNSGWSLQIGGSAGMAKQKIKATVVGAMSGASMGASISERKWTAALGVQVNVIYKCNQTASVQFGVRGLWTDETDYNESGVTTMVTAGIGFRF